MLYSTKTASYCQQIDSRAQIAVIAGNEFIQGNFAVCQGVGIGGQGQQNGESIAQPQRFAVAAGKLYGIRSIPSNILLSPDGTIIGRNLRGDDLRNKLEELMP